MPLDVQAITFAVSGSLSFLLALVLFVRARRQTAPALLGTYLIALGGFLFQPALMTRWDFSGLFPLVIGLLMIVGNLSLLAFMAAYPLGPTTPLRKWFVGWVLLAAAVFFVAWAWQPRLFTDVDWTPRESMWNFVRLLHQAAAFVGIVVFGHRFQVARTGFLRHQTAFVLLPFCWFGVNHIFSDMARILGDQDAIGSDAPYVNVVSVLNAVAILGLAILVCRRLARHADAPGRAVGIGLLLGTILASLQLLPTDRSWMFHLVLDSTVIMTLWYGVIRHHALDIDFKLKWTLRRGTLAAAFVGAFFVVSETAQFLFEGAIGPLAGIVAAGLLVFAIAPLQRWTERFADRAMPNVHDERDYIRVRKSEVYGAAVESVIQDGQVTTKERDVLTRLQLELGIANQDARAIEADVARRFPGVAP